MSLAGHATLLAVSLAYVSTCMICHLLDVSFAGCVACWMCRLLDVSFAGCVALHNSQASGLHAVYKVFNLACRIILQILIVKIGHQERNSLFWPMTGPVW